MAVSQNPMTGKMSGTVGNFVTSSYRGRNVVKSKAFNPKDANTEAQQKHRSVFRMMSEEYVSLASIVNNGFPSRPKTQSPYNAFMAVNLSGAVDKSGIEPVIDYSKMVVSKGSLVRVNLLGAVADAEGVTISYQTLASYPGASEDDRVVAVLKTTDGAVLTTQQSRGSEDTASMLLPLPDAVKEHLLYAYLLVLSADMSKASLSVYVEIT